MGCASLSSQSPLKGLGTQPKGAHFKTAKAIAIHHKTKRKPLNIEQAEAELELARQKAKLAELKMELSVLEMKVSDYHQKIAENMLSKAKISQRRQKLEAEQKAGRVKKAVAIDKIKALETNSLGLDSDNINAKSAIAKLKLDIQELKRKIN
jgi:hypothetical protein